MTIRERVLASRLINKTYNNESYARQIGISCRLKTTEKSTNFIHTIHKEEKSNTK